MRERLRAYAQLARLPALFTAWSNILAAHLIATSGQIDWRMLLLLLGSSSALYLSGMVLNDCFDIEEDRRERPQRPLPSGQIAVGDAHRLGGGLMLTGCLLAGVAGWLQLTIAVALSVTILVYDGWLKKYAVGSLAMGACRYLNWFLGLSQAPLTAAVWLLPVPIFLYISALTSLSRIETSARGSIPLTVCIAGMLATACSILLLYYFGILEHGWALVPAAVLLALLLRSLFTTYGNMTPASVQGNVKMMLLGVILLDAVLVLAVGPWWGGALILLLLIPGRLLARAIYIT